MKLGKSFAFAQGKELTWCLERSCLSPEMRAGCGSKEEAPQKKHPKLQHGGGEDNAGLLDLSDEPDTKG